MSRTSSGLTKKRSFGFHSLWAFLFVAFLLPAVPAPAAAQTVVVSRFKGKPKKAVRRIQKAITKALKNNDVKITPFKRYLRQARKMKIKPRVMFKPKNIERIAAKLEIDGVVLGKVLKKKRQFIIVLNLHDQDGSLLTSKEFTAKKPRLPKEQLAEIVAVVKKIMGKDDTEEAPAVAAAESLEADSTEEAPATEVAPEVTMDTPDVTEVATETPAATADTESVTEEAPASDVSDTAVTTEEETKPEIKPLDMDAMKPFMAPKDEAATTAEAEVESDPVLLRKKKKFGAVPDIFVTAGFAISNRQGLNPRHESNMVSSLRFDGRFFLGSVLDMFIVKDIGISGMAIWALPHNYGTDIAGRELKASQIQWQAELNYRLALNDLPLKPAFIVRGGYGSAISDIETDNDFVHDAGYTFTYVALDTYLMLMDPLLRMHVSGGYLINVWAAKHLRGTGSGFTARAGVDAELFDMISVGIGYELWQFLDVYVPIQNSAGNFRKTSDTFQNFYIRAGWSFQ